MNRSLDIVGPYPPPFGGISIHIARIEFFLKKEKINYKIYNHGYYSSDNVIATNKSGLWYINYLFRKQSSLVHFHQFFKFHYFYFFLFSFLSKKKIIVTIHEENILFYNRILKKLIVLLIRNTKFSSLVSVSDKLSDFLTKNGINNICLPAYVPPNKTNPIMLKKRDEKKYFLYSIWKVDRKISEDVYNIELAFKLLNKVKNSFQMLFLIGTEVESDKLYLSSLLNRYKIMDSITIIYERPLVDYLNNCEFLLRTNNVDGYGVSLQEALDLKISAIASDVCVRPKGTILFKKDNLDDLYEKVININKYWNESEIETPDYHIQLMELYKKHLS